MKMFLDFDDCLFDTKYVTGDFLRDLRAIYARVGGWDEALIASNAEQFTNASFEKNPNTYSPEKHLRALEERVPSGRLEQALRETRHFLEHLESYVFPDTVPFLESFPRKDLAILTFGDPGFQRAKIVGAGLSHFVSDILVTEGEGKIACIERYAQEHQIPPSETVVFVDDKATYFDERPNQRDVATILLDRTGGLSRGNSGYVAHDLIDVARILESIS